MLVNTYNIAFAVTPSDSADLPNGVTDALLVSAAVDGSEGLAFHDAAGNVVTLAVVLPGVLPIKAKRILDTGTDCDVVALYAR